MVFQEALQEEGHRVITEVRGEVANTQPPLFGKWAKPVLEPCPQITDLLAESLPPCSVLLKNALHGDVGRVVHREQPVVRRGRGGRSQSRALLVCSDRPADVSLLPVDGPQGIVGVGQVWRNLCSPLEVLKGATEVPPRHARNAQPQEAAPEVCAHIPEQGPERPACPISQVVDRSPLSNDHRPQVRCTVPLHHCLQFSASITLGKSVILFPQGPRSRNTASPLEPCQEARVSHECCKRRSVSCAHLACPAEFGLLLHVSHDFANVAEIILRLLLCLFHICH
mmetsp:Transcript_9382/g.27737  ORF Transcript_9382/g.27737 Transcript_9382/m.27737 type:complete len:282 (-) Transcript_9382:40-885(-)